VFDVTSNIRGAQAMHKVVVLYPYPQDEAKFRAYYASGHIPIARKIPGLIASRYSMAVEGMGAASPYFCIFEAEFADAAAMASGMGSPEGRATGADVANFATTPPLIVHYEVEG
jgi:uncharacterized protein (TIGR02118 family)